MARVARRPATTPRVGQRLLPIDWGELSPLRLRARVVAEGVFAGMHHSAQRGAGVEFGGQRPYVPGDDLRFLDRRSMLKHDRLMVREFETDTDRALWLCLDATASMAFRSPEAPGAKLAYAALIAAALTRVAVTGRDPVGLAWLGGAEVRDVPAAAGEGAFERVVGTIEGVVASGDMHAQTEQLDRFVRALARRAKRGSIVVFFSDLLDLPAEARRRLTSLAAHSRALVVVQVWDPAERDLSFRGKVRLRAMEGDDVVETDADVVRERYQRRLEAHTARWQRTVHSEGGRLVRACSTDAPVQVVRGVVQAVGEARR